MPGSRIRPAETVALLNAGYRDPSELGVLLTDGVGEIELASVFRPYTELSYLARPDAITLDGSPIRSRHGLTFVPRSTLGPSAHQLDRLLVPGEQAATHAEPATVRAADAAGLEPEYIHLGGDEFPFDPVLHDIAETTDVATARWVAKSLEYQVQGELSGSAWPWTLTAKLAIAGLLGAIVARLGRVRPAGSVVDRADLRHRLGRGQILAPHSRRANSKRPAAMSLAEDSRLTQTPEQPHPRRSSRPLLTPSTSSPASTTSAPTAASDRAGRHLGAFALQTRTSRKDS